MGESLTASLDNRWLFFGKEAFKHLRNALQTSDEMDGRTDDRRDGQGRQTDGMEGRTNKWEKPVGRMG